MEEKARGIVLSFSPYGENDKILKIFTLEYGILSARIKGVKKSGAKLKFAAEPFCFAEYVFMKTGEKRTVVSASLIDSFYPLRENMDKYFCGATVLDFLRKFCKEEMVNPSLFLAATDALKKLAYTVADERSVLCGFLLSALAISGYALNISGCFSCKKDISKKAFFDVNSGGFLCEDCFSGFGREINISTFLALKNISEGNSDKNAVLALRLIDYFMVYKLETELKPLKELIKE